MLEFRNAVKNSNGSYTCEVNHPNLGWIPYTAADGDAESQELWDYFETQVVPDATMSPALREALAKSECKRRILLKADRETQTNIVSAKAAGELNSVQDASDYMGYYNWIHGMRGNISTIMSGSLDPLDDANWPTAPAAVDTLAARF